SGIVFPFKAATADAPSSFGATCARAPVAPFPVERAVAHNRVINDATAGATSSARKSHRDDAAICYADAIVLSTGIPAKLIDTSARYDFEATGILASVGIRSKDSISASEISSRTGSSITGSISSWISVRPVMALRNRDRKSTRLNSSHDQISYAVF